MLIKAIQSEPGMTINEPIEEVNLEISKTTDQRGFTDHGLECNTMPVKWFMTEKQKKDRLRWAKEHIEKDKKLQQKVIFTDEALVQFNIKRQRCWIDKDTKLGPIERDRGQFSLLLWGAISLERNCILEVMIGKLYSNDFEKKY